VSGGIVYAPLAAASHVENPWPKENCDHETRQSEIHETVGPMRRADRLFQIIQLIRRHRVTTANDLARALEVSGRTVYRDIRDLVASGVPIDGEAGVGYMLRKGFDLPPLMFTEAEIEALVLGARVVTSWTDPALG